MDVTKAAIGDNGFLASGFATTSAPNELLFGFAVGGDPVPGDGGFANVVPDDAGDLVEDEVAVAPGSYQATAMDLPDAGAWIMLMATLKGQ